MLHSDPKLLCVTTKAPTAQNGFAVRDFRIKAQLTPDELAQRVGISTPHLRNIENEHKSASDVDLEKIATACECRVQSLRRIPRAHLDPEVVPAAPISPGRLRGAAASARRSAPVAV